MKPALRNFALTAHVMSSVGWFGAVAAFLALTVSGLTSNDAQTIRTVYLAAKPIVWYAIVPLAVASLVTGIVQALGTHWGLFQHYWVLFKLLLTLFATFILLMYTQTVDSFAAMASEPNPVDASGLFSFRLHSGAALVVLLVTTILAVYKPRGLTSFGRRKRQEHNFLKEASSSDVAPDRR